MGRPLGARHGGRAAVALRLAATAELDDRDGHWLAGFLDAEGSFGIVRNNGGRNWRCFVRTTVRRDDAPLLFRLQQATGLGTIVGVPARAGSKPQACWTINSGLECCHLADVLERHPLRGRKRQDAATWSTAVRSLEAGHRGDLPDLAQLIRTQRHYQDPGDDACHPPRDEPGLVWYLGGFFTGEGWFQLDQRSARAGIKLRRDDRPLLRAFASITGLGKIYEVTRTGDGNPASTWIILNQGELAATVEALESARLLGRKQREFRVWRVGVQEFVAARCDERPRDPWIIDAAAAVLREVRTYSDLALARPADERVESRAAFVEILGAFGRLAPTGELTCTRYMQLRRENPDWPQHATLTRAFGSWSAALDAARLGHRAHPRSAKRSQSGPPRVRTGGSSRRPGARPPR